MTVAVTGDAGKVLAMQLKLAKFGIVQLARTGKISLKRGRQVLHISHPLGYSRMRNIACLTHCDQLTNHTS